MLQHKNIASLYKVLESDAFVFFIMELCQGGTLYDFTCGRVRKKFLDLFLL